MEWKSIEIPEGCLEGTANSVFMCMEELEGVNVVRKDGIVHFKKEKPKGKRKVKIRDLVISTEEAPESSWNAQVPLHPMLVNALLRNGFNEPTQVQRECLFPGITQFRSIVAAAETGSGKTLAFGLPMLHYILSRPDKFAVPGCGIVLAPTRELALQIVEHLAALETGVCIVPIVGGMAEQKQERLLLRHPHIIVGTPGRMREFVDSGRIPVAWLRACRFFVVDEADRMLQFGKYKDLDHIAAQIKNANFYVFSATMPTSGDALGSLLERLSTGKYAVVDLTGQCKALVHRKISCTQTNKDLILYYLLVRYPGRTMVFVNAISMLKRLLPLLRMLKVPANGLHAKMQQRARLKSLERFAQGDSVLVCSDVAARGIDIKRVDHVIHYQAPMSQELYVHRSGRTARANEEGLTIVLDNKFEGKEFKVDDYYLNALKPRVILARKLETMLHRGEDIAEMREELESMLRTPILPKGTDPQFLSLDTAKKILSNKRAMPCESTSAIADAKRRFI